MLRVTLARLALAGLLGVAVLGIDAGAQEDFDLIYRDNTVLYCPRTSTANCQSPEEITSLDALVRVNNAIADHIDVLNDANQGRLDQLKAVMTHALKAEALATVLAKAQAAAEAFRTTAQTLAEDVQAATARHLAWVQQFRTRIQAEVPTWSSMTDLASYQAIISQITRFEQSTADDRALTVQEAALRKRLEPWEAIKLAGQIDGLLSAVLIEEVSPADAPALRSMLLDASAALQQFARVRARQQSVGSSPLPHQIMC